VPRSAWAAYSCILRAELNFHRLFEQAMEDFSVKRVAERQTAALKRAICRRPANAFGVAAAGAGCTSAVVQLNEPWVRSCPVSESPAAAIPPGLPSCRIPLSGGSMVVRLGCSLALAIAVLAPQPGRADCAQEISQLMSGTPKSWTTRFNRIAKRSSRKAQPRLLAEECRIARALQPRLESQLAALSSPAV
jgi:hypothetical protein